MSCMNFTVHNKEGESPLDLEFERVFAIGYAGRNMEKTMEHTSGSLSGSWESRRRRRFPPFSSAETMC